MVANAIDAGNLVFEMTLFIPIPLLELIFLAVIILFFAREGLEVHQLIGGAVDAHIGGQGRSEDIAPEIGGAAVDLKICMENVRSIGPEVGPEIVLGL